MIGITGTDFIYNTMGWSAEKLAILLPMQYNPLKPKKTMILMALYMTKPEGVKLWKTKT